MTSAPPARSTLTRSPAHRARRTPLAPPSCRAWAWIPPLTIFLVVFVTLAAMLFVFSAIGLPRIQILVLALAALFGVPLTIAMALERQRLARARSHWYRLCPHCKHDLRLLGDQGTCPSCSRPFTRDQLIKRWERVEPKAARAKRWRPLSTRGSLPPQLIMTLAPAFIASLLGALLIWLQLIPPSLFGLAFAAMGPGFALLQPIILKRDRQDLDHLQACNFQICPECLSALPTLSDPAQGDACCFTCGQQYTTPWLEETWGLAYAHLKAARRFGFQPSHAVRRTTIAFGVAMLALGLLAAFFSRLGLFAIPRSLTIALITLIALGILAYVAYLTSRINHHHTNMLRLRALEYRFCPECAYDLREAPSHATCPECGTPFTPESLRERWETAPKVDPPPMESSKSTL